MPHRCMALAALAFSFLALGGCTYHLRGIVVESAEGPASIEVVGSHDSRLSDEGLRYAVLELTVDPDSHTPNYMSPVRTDSHGRFSIPISETGAGFLMYKLDVIARADGHQAVRDSIDLPPGFKRVVVTLPRGRDTIKRPSNFDEEQKGMQQLERDLR